MITQRQIEALKHVKRTIEEEGVAPSHRELAEVIGTCPFTARRDLMKLADMGFIKVWPDKVRRIKVLRMPEVGEIVQ